MSRSYAQAVLEYKLQKMQEVEKKVHTMRARHPPRALINSTIRNPSQHTGLSRKPSKDATELMKDIGIMNDDIYKKLKESIHPPSPKKVPVNKNNQTSDRSSDSDPAIEPNATYDFSTSSHANYSSGSIMQSNNSNNNSPKHDQNDPEDENRLHSIASYSSLITELSTRGLTEEAKKRKLAATIKREVEKQIFFQK